MNQQNNLSVHKLYCPLMISQGYYIPDEYGWERDYQYSQLDAMDAAFYEDVIQEKILEDYLKSDDAYQKGLMEYFWCHNGNELEQSIKEKVTFAWPWVEVHHEKLYGVFVYETKEPLTPEELQELKDFASGQFSDGWGEGFGQREIKTSNSDLCVSFYDSGMHDDVFSPTEYYILSSEEFGLRPDVNMDIDLMRKNPFVCREQKVLSYQIEQLEKRLKTMENKNPQWFLDKNNTAEIKELVSNANTIIKQAVEQSVLLPEFNEAMGNDVQQIM